MSIKNNKNGIQMDTLPEWYQEAEAELRRLNGHWKQRTTIMAIIDQELLGSGYDSPLFWKKPGTCARSTFYKWKEQDQRFTQVLKNVRTIAAQWQTAEAVIAISQARLKLQLASPIFADKVIQLAAKAMGENTQLRAALAGMAIASEETAPKGAGTVKVDGLDDALERIYGESDSDSDD